MENRTKNQQDNVSHVVLLQIHLSDQERQEFMDLVEQNLSDSSSCQVHVVEEDTDGTQLRTEMYPFYFFEGNLKFWQLMFRAGRETPLCVQKVFLYDYLWKLKNSVLWPYHYQDEKLTQAKQAVHALLNEISDQTILELSGVESFHRFYLLEQKTTGQTQVEVTSEQIQIMRNGKQVYETKKIEVVLTKFKIFGSQIHLVAYLKSPVFNFCEAPTLWMEANGDREHLQEIPLQNSSWNYYHCKEETNHFYTFVLRINCKKIQQFHFYVKCRDQLFDTYYYFMPEVVFNNQIKCYRYYAGKRVYRFDHNTFLVEKASKKQAEKYQSDLEKQWEMERQEIITFRHQIRQERQNKRRIWLYYDCKGVYRDNGYLQFVHDFGQEDGVEKYYVLNNDLDSCRELFTEEQLPYVISFGSEQHKLLYCMAEQIITAYIEKNNYQPFADQEYSCVMDVSSMPYITYLQHGVYHAFIPWKYSLDRLQVDRKVISATIEHKQDIETHCFTAKQELASGMPRYDLMDLAAKPEKRILYAPSWRKYLVGMEQNEWVTREDFFLASKFYQETSKLLQDTALITFLREQGYTLDFKLHPILMRYDHLYQLDDRVVRVVQGSVREEDYAIFITDFSSYVFDFAYLERSILYFFPDYGELSSGMSDYRDYNLPFQGIGSRYADNAEDAAKCIRAMVRRGGKLSWLQRRRMKKLFYHKDQQARERIYQSLIHSR